MKNIVLIGSGNLAEALARAISRTEGATLLQIFARNAKRGTALALENGTAWSSDPRELAAADLYILAVSDAAITTLAESLPIPAEAVVQGDGKIAAISAASILAKTARDAQMYALDAQYPQYGFARHKGYGTAAHLAALQQHGVLPQHRADFAPVRALLAQGRLFEKLD